MLTNSKGECIHAWKVINERNQAICKDCGYNSGQLTKSKTIKQQIIELIASKFISKTDKYILTGLHKTDTKQWSEHERLIFKEVKTRVQKNKLAQQRRGRRKGIC